MPPSSARGLCSRRVAVSAGLNTAAEQSEDCLTLNVWTPAVDDARRPVMVYLHGGAFITGAGSWPMYNGATLARRGDVVVVTINYRLGLFGYLRGIDVCGDALPSTGNEGLLDQIAALTWVKQEIAAFGGDPDNVTVFGTSAGSCSIGLMLAMPRTHSLFQKGVMQSGRAFVNTPERAARVTGAILADLGLAPGEADRLRELPAAQLLDIQTRVTPRAGGVAYGPVADGTDVPADPEAAIAGGSAAGIPLLVGTNLEEYKFYRRMDSAVEHLTDDTLLARLADPRTTAQAGDNPTVDPNEAVALYRRERASRSESTAAPELWFAIMTDRRFRVPSMRLAELHAAHTPATYAYLFTWKSPGVGWQARRRPRGEHAVRLRHTRRPGQPGPGASRVARRRTPDPDAGRLDRLRPHGQPSDSRRWRAGSRTPPLAAPRCCSAPPAARLRPRSKPSDGSGTLACRPAAPLPDGNILPARYLDNRAPITWPTTDGKWMATLERSANGRRLSLASTGCERLPRVEPASRRAVLTTRPPGVPDRATRRATTVPEACRGWCECVIRMTSQKGKSSSKCDENWVTTLERNKKESDTVDGWLGGLVSGRNEQDRDRRRSNPGVLIGLVQNKRRNGRPLACPGQVLCAIN